MKMCIAKYFQIIMSPKHTEYEGRKYIEFVWINMLTMIARLT